MYMATDSLNGREEEPFDCQTVEQEETRTHLW